MEIRPKVNKTRGIHGIEKPNMNYLLNIIN